MARSPVLNLTSSLRDIDLLSSPSHVLSDTQKKDVRSKFGRVGGSWCCAPTPEMKTGAPRSAHFRLL